MRPLLLDLPPDHLDGPWPRVRWTVAFRFVSAQHKSNVSKTEAVETTDKPLQPNWIAGDVPCTPIVELLDLPTTSFRLSVCPSVRPSIHPSTHSFVPSRQPYEVVYHDLLPHRHPLRLLLHHPSCPGVIKALTSITLATIKRVIGERAHRHTYQQRPSEPITSPAAAPLSLPSLYPFLFLPLPSHLP